MPPAEVSWRLSCLNALTQAWQVGERCVKLFWRPLLFGFFQVTDCLALEVLQSLRHAPRRHCLKAQYNK